MKIFVNGKNTDSRKEFIFNHIIKFRNENNEDPIIIVTHFQYTCDYYKELTKDMANCYVYTDGECRGYKLEKLNNKYKEGLVIYIEEGNYSMYDGNLFNNFNLIIIREEIDVHYREGYPKHYPRINTFFIFKSHNKYEDICIYLSRVFGVQINKYLLSELIINENDYALLEILDNGEYELNKVLKTSNIKKSIR